MKRLRIRLRWQLMLSYLPLILTPLILTVLITRGVTEQGLTVAVTERAQDRARELATPFENYYAEHGSWEGVSALIVVVPMRPPWLPIFAGHPPDAGFAAEQILITDLNGIIVASDSETGLGETLSTSVLARGAPLIAHGKQIGTLVIGAALGALDDQQHQFLDVVNHTLIASSLVLASLAIALGLGLSWQITRPVQQLMLGVRRLSLGEWTEPLQVTSTNEFGDLTHSFNTMAAEVTHQQQLRRQMVADVAHDLRTPISAMLLDIEAIEAGLQSPAEAAVSLREEITWLQRLIDDLRTLSLMDADQMHLQRNPTALYPFVESVFDFWQPMTDEQSREFTFEADPALPQALIDAGRMRQVLGNLLDNAIQHTAPGGHITLGACIEPSSNGGTDQAVIYVSDNGEGIDPHDLPHIFDRFYRADKARMHTAASDAPYNASYSATHSGLGLSIAQRLTELHAGSISVQSRLGHGTTFRVSLPVYASRKAVNPQTERASSPAPLLRERGVRPIGEDQSQSLKVPASREREVG